jgi:hypothetical protein
MVLDLIVLVRFDLIRAPTINFRYTKLCENQSLFTLTKHATADTESPSIFDP